MLHIDTFTLGNEFKDTDNNIWKVTGNLSEEKKLYIQLDLVEPVEDLIEETI